MRPITVTVGPVGTVAANNIALSQTPGGPGALTLNGSLVAAGVAILSSPQRVLITTADTTHSFVIVGLSPTGTFLTETIADNGTSVQSTLDYAKITSITMTGAGAATAAITVGTNGIASTPWVRLDEWANAQTSIGIDVSGVVSFTVQSSNDDPNSPTNPVAPQSMTWVNTNDAAAVNATVALMTNFLISPLWARVLLNSGAGSITANFVQAGAVPY